MLSQRTARLTYEVFESPIFLSQYVKAFHQRLEMRIRISDDLGRLDQLPSEV